MLKYKRLKFRLMQRKNVKGVLNNQKIKLNYGIHGLKALESGILTKRQIEATRRTFTRQVKKINKLWVKSRLNKLSTSKSQGTRMGSGKGKPNLKIRYIRTGELLFELGVGPSERMLNTLKKCKYKLPIKTRWIITKDELWKKN